VHSAMDFQSFTLFHCLIFPACAPASFVSFSVFAFLLLSAKQRAFSFLSFHFSPTRAKNPRLASQKVPLPPPCFSSRSIMLQHPTKSVECSTGTEVASNAKRQAQDAEQRKGNRRSEGQRKTNDTQRGDSENGDGTGREKYTCGGRSSNRSVAAAGRARSRARPVEVAHVSQRPGADEVLDREGRREHEANNSDDDVCPSEE